MQKLEFTNTNSTVYFAGFLPNQDNQGIQGILFLHEKSGKQGVKKQNQGIINFVI